MNIQDRKPFSLKQDGNVFQNKRFDPTKKLPASEFQQNVGEKSRMKKESILWLDSKKSPKLIAFFEKISFWEDENLSSSQKSPKHT